MIKNSQIPKNIKDKIINFLLSFKRGIFVDVGAFDGINYSNTYDLLTNDWFGIYVEPNENSCNKLNKNCGGYSYILHNLAASNVDDKEVEFYLNGEFSSVVPMNEVVKAQNIKQEIVKKVKTVTLDTLLNQLNTYQFLSIDVEKHEIEVLEGYDISKHNPFFAVVETHAKDHRYSKKISNYCDFYFNKKKYKKYFSDRVNTIYYHKKTGNLL